MAAMLDPPVVSKVIVYRFIFHEAVIVRSSAGIFAGIALSHPLKVYPVLVGSAGAVIAVPISCDIGAIFEPPAVSNVIVNGLSLHTALIVIL